MSSTLPTRILLWPRNAKRLFGSIGAGANSERNHLTSPTDPASSPHPGAISARTAEVTPPKRI